jgi:hypothetical protein
LLVVTVRLPLRAAAAGFIQAISLSQAGSAMTSSSKVTASADETPVSGPGIYWLMLLLGIALLALMPWQAGWVNTERGWFVQPRFSSSLGLLVLVLFSAVRVVQYSRRRHFPGLGSLLGCLGGYRTAVLSSVLFLVYINSLSVLGFMLSTLLFLTTLLWLSRLLDRFWLWVVVATVVALVLIFRIGVSVWLPDVWLYGLLPDSWADIANQYL